MVLLSIQWWANKGWSYTVIDFGPNAGETETTMIPHEKGSVSELVAEVDCMSPLLSEADRVAIKATAMQRWPDVKVEFGPAPKAPAK